MTDEKRRPRTSLSVCRRRFGHQLSLLIGSGYAPVTLSKLVCLKKEDVPGKYVAITFDDGSRDLRRFALPVLQTFRAPATVFVITGFVDGRSYFPWDLRLSEQHGISLTEDDLSMSWDELAMLIRHGWEIGSHTVSHPLLTEIPLDEAHREIGESKRMIETQLGVKVTSFCYPARYADAEIVRLVRSCGYRQAVISFLSLPLDNGVSLPDCGYFTLNRVGIYRRDDMLRFWCKIAGIYEPLQRSKLWMKIAGFRTRLSEKALLSRR